MGTIVFHAGMPKAGSSTIQTWIQQHTDWIRSELGVHLLVFRGRRGDDPGGLVPYDRGRVNSGAWWFRYLISERDPAVVRELIEPLDRFADQLGSVLLTSESFATPIAEREQAFLLGLEELASRHTVRVAYYVRPQPESLEAAWRQWGFRSGRSPADYVRFRERLLDYEGTRTHVQRAAPRVHFEPRLLGLAPSLVDDFAGTFLGAPGPVDHDPTWSNAGMPLEVVNALRFAPPGMFWDSIFDNGRFERIKDLFRGCTIEPSEAINRSRQLLHRHCWDEFEAANQAMAHALGWQVDHVIPPPAVDDEGETLDLDRLDALWSSPIAESDLPRLLTALQLAIEDASGYAARDARGFVLESFGAHPPGGSTVRT